MNFIITESKIFKFMDRVFDVEYGDLEMHEISYEYYGDDKERMGYDFTTKNGDTSFYIDGRNRLIMDIYFLRKLSSLFVKNESDLANLLRVYLISRFGPEANFTSINDFKHGDD
jgi:hypothetical protein